MRKKLLLEHNAERANMAFARNRQLSLGKAASELVRRGARYQIGTRRVNELPVLDAPEYLPVITSHRVKELCDEG